MSTTDDIYETPISDSPEPSSPSSIAYLSKRDVLTILLEETQNAAHLHLELAQRAEHVITNQQMIVNHIQESLSRLLDAYSVFPNLYMAVWTAMHDPQQRHFLPYLARRLGVEPAEVEEQLLTLKEQMMAEYNEAPDMEDDMRRLMDEIETATEELNFHNKKAEEYMMDVKALEALVAAEGVEEEEEDEEDEGDSNEQEDGMEDESVYTENF